MYFFVEEAQSTDYEWIQIDYDFENNKVNSFVLYQYVTIQSEEDFCSAYKYENETLSIANQEDSNFAEFKNSVKEMSTGLADAQEFAQEYDFTAEYIKVYNTYNPNSPLE